MSTSDPALSGEDGAQPVILGPTLQEVLDAVLEMRNLPSQARQNLASSLRTLARALDREPRFISAAAPALRQAFAEASPGAIGLSSSRWRNVQSDVRRAVRLSGVVVDGRAARQPLSEAWEAIVPLAPDATRRSFLRRFGRFCSARQIAPAEVSDDTIGIFYAFLDQNHLSKAPKRITKDLIRCWNSHVASHPSGTYSALDLPDESRSYTPPWEELPEALAADARAFKHWRLKPVLFPMEPNHCAEEPDRFAEEPVRKAVRPATADQQDRMLRRLAAAEIHAGVDPAELQSLAELVQPERLKKGLQFFLDRNNGEPNRQVFEMAFLALTVARYWARLPKKAVAVLVSWVARVRPEKRGMTQKNRDRLRQFADPKVLQALLLLPDRLIAKARRRPLDSRSALLMQTAVAISLLLTVAPLRIANLLSLDRNRHFVRGMPGAGAGMHLVIPAEEVKNEVDLEFTIPPRTMAMIELYMSNYQPLLSNGVSSSCLFPGREGAPKWDSALRRNITQTLLKEAGLHVNPHLFRHLCAFIYLRANPGDYETVRQLLGHKNRQITIDFYTDLEVHAARERYQDLMNREYETARKQLPRRGRRQRQGEGEHPLGL